MSRLNTLLFLLLNTSYALAYGTTFHEGKFATPEKEIPNECKGYMGGDYKDLTAYNYKFEPETDLCLVLRLDGSDNVIGLNQWIKSSSRVCLYPRYFYTDSILPGFAQSYKAEQFCAINEAMKNGIIDFKSSAIVLHINTNKKFGDGPGDDIGHGLDEHAYGIYERSYGNNGVSHSFGNVLILDDRNDAVFAYVPIVRNKDESLASAVQRVYLEILKQAQNEVKRVNKGYFEKQIPPLPAKPNMPTTTTINKETFETTDQFTKRVEQVRQEEQKKREQTAQDYINKLEYRNKRIVELEEEYAHALDVQAKENQRIADWIFDNQLDIMKWITKNIVSSYLIGTPYQIVINKASKDTAYDADAGRLSTYLNYGDGCYSNVAIFIPPNDAKKLSKIYKRFFSNIKIELSSDNGQLVIGKLFVKDDDSDWYEVQEGLSPFKPRKIEIVIRHEPINAPKLESSLDAFKAGIPTTDIVWQSTASVVVADLYNPKVPAWFSKPDMKNNTGYGTGLTLDDAKSDALRELALRSGMSVTAEQSTTTKANSFSIIEETLTKKVDVKTSKAYTGSFKLIRQEFIDGRWYVIVEKTDI